MKIIENALITGASRGIGFAIAKKLAGNGVNLIITANEADGLKKAKTELERFGVSVSAINSDMGNKSDMIKMRQVSEVDGRTYADDLGVPFYETSAKTGENVNLAFNRIAKELYAKHPPLKVGPKTAVD